MTNEVEKVDQIGKNNLALILIWLGVLTGAIATMLILGAIRTSDLKSDVFTTTPSIQYIVPSTYLPNLTTKPGPDPWTPVTVNTTTTR
ncbi:MAG TPA: hypothetical protein P5229_01635 [Candidatus Gracilibacteria bacterium]|nr:hypothetical protein [Candidatus Gracilibacteria bacterium]